MESLPFTQGACSGFFILGGVYIKKRIFCFILSVLVATSAYFSACDEAKQVSAAVVVDDALILAGLLASLGYATTITTFNNWKSWEDTYPDYGMPSDEKQRIEDLINDGIKREIDREAIRLGLISPDLGALIPVPDGDGDGSPDNDNNDDWNLWDTVKAFIKRSAVEGDLAGTFVVTAGLWSMLGEWGDVLKGGLEGMADEALSVPEGVSKVDSSLNSNLQYVHSGIYFPLTGSSSFRNGAMNVYNSHLEAGDYIGIAVTSLHHYVYIDYFDGEYDCVIFMKGEDCGFGANSETLYGFMGKSSDMTYRQTHAIACYSGYEYKSGNTACNQFIADDTSGGIYISPEYPIYYYDTLVSTPESLSSGTLFEGSNRDTYPAYPDKIVVPTWPHVSGLAYDVNDASTDTDKQGVVDQYLNDLNNVESSGDPGTVPGTGTGTGSDSTEDPDTGGDTGEDSDTDTSGMFQTLWDWLRKILEAILALPQSMIDLLVNFFQTLWEWLRQILDAILSLPGFSQISEFFSGLFQTLWQWLQQIIDNIVNAAAQLAQWLEQIWDSICNLPETIGDLIKSIFVPDTAALQDIYDDLNESVGNIFGIDNYDLDTLWSDSGPPSDISGTLDMGNYRYTGVIASFRFLIDGVDAFRPYIRGFVVLLLVIFNIRQALSMFGLSSGELKSAARGSDE